MILIAVGVLVFIVGLFIFAHLLAYDQREKPTHVYVRCGPDLPPYYPESLRRFLAETEPSSPVAAAREGQESLEQDSS